MQVSQQGYDGKPMLDFALYNEPYQQKKAQEKIMFAPPLYQPNPNMYYQYAPNQGQAPYGMNYNMPVQKYYTLNMAGPTGNHVAMNKIFEDVIPGKDWNSTMNTLGERLMIYSYIRGTFSNLEDGADISLESDKGQRNSLMSYLRFIELNSGSYNRLYNNPYKNLADGFLLYSSCYPINYSDGRIKCSKNSISINIRVYRLANKEYELYQIRNEGYLDYDVWRELSYYEYIREEIIKKKICPNFPLLYIYFISKGNKINFEKLKLVSGNNIAGELKKLDLISDGVIRNVKKSLFQDTITTAEKDLVIEGIMTKIVNRKFPKMDSAGKIRAITNDTFKKIIYSIIEGDGIAIEYLRAIELNPFWKEILKSIVYEITDPANKKDVPIDSNIKTVVIPANIAGKISIGTNVYKEFLGENEYSGNCLVSLTEAPNYNLYTWASRTYEMGGSIKKMIRTGYFNDNIWMSIIFQIMAALYTLQIHGIAFKDLSIENNIFIKDLQTDVANVGYWKYIINDVSYYVPNFGYLVLIDSNFADVVKPEYNIINQGIDKKYKIYSTMFGDEYGNSEKTVDEFAINGFKNVFNPNSFTKDNIKNGVSKPPEKIMNLIKKIYDDPEKNIGKYIFKYMKEYLHNRIGQYLYKDLEIPNMRQETHKNFTIGHMTIYEPVAYNFKWALITGKKNPMTFIVCTKNLPTDKDFEEKEVSIAQLREYQVGEMVAQKFKVGQKIGEDDLLETYTIRAN